MHLNNWNIPLPLQTFLKTYKQTTVDTLSYKTISANKNTVNKRWFVVDAEGKTLGRFSSEVAKVLRGKNKPDFTPHVDCGDYVIVVNADKIHLEGGKMETKQYIHHTGYPGGQKVTLAKELLDKKPEALIEKAVKGMLPKNRLGRKIFGNLHVYAGTNHPHEAQQPQKLDI